MNQQIKDRQSKRAKQIALQHKPPKFWAVVNLDGVEYIFTSQLKPTSELPPDVNVTRISLDRGM